jgi:alkyl hydroperoxide reductase subunit AhpC
VPAFDSDREKFAALDAQVLDISVDSILSHIAWQKKEIGMMQLPMCSDFYPHGEVTQAFGILREGLPVAGISERAVFIVDRSGRIAFAKVYPLDNVPDNKELLEVLGKMRGEQPGKGESF